MQEETDIKIKELEDKLAEMENNWKRALADYRNYQKRTDEEKVSYIDFSNEILIRKILPVLDNLEMLSPHIKDEGLNLIIKELAQTLRGEGITEIETQAKEFDSTTMEAIELVDGEENKVIEVLSKGYFLKDKILRPARVKVGKGNPSEE